MTASQVCVQPRISAQMAILRINSLDGSKELAQLRTCRLEKPQAPLIAPVLFAQPCSCRGTGGDPEGEGQARSCSVRSGHFETTEGEQMEKEPQMNIHKKKINYLPYVPPAPSTQLSPQLWEAGGVHTNQSLHLEGFQSPRVQCQTWNFGTPDLKGWNMLCS